MSVVLEREERVARYMRPLQAMLDRRPSGPRGRIAAALGVQMIAMLPDDPDPVVLATIRRQVLDHAGRLVALARLCVRLPGRDDAASHGVAD